MLHFSTFKQVKMLLKDIAYYLDSSHRKAIPKLRIAAFVPIDTHKKIIKEKRSNEINENNACSDINHSVALVSGGGYNRAAYSHGSNALSCAQDIID